jgi:hypothetical protein
MSDGRDNVSVLQPFFGDAASEPVRAVYIGTLPAVAVKDMTVLSEVDTQACIATPYFCRQRYAVRRNSYLGHLKG